MEIAAQLLRGNTSLEVLELTDNPIGPLGVEAIADAFSESRPQLCEAHLGNLGLTSGSQMQRLLRDLRHSRAPLSVLDLHGNCLLPPLSDETCDPHAWLQSTPQAAHMVLAHTVRPPLGALLMTCTMCDPGGYMYYHIWQARRRPTTSTSGAIRRSEPSPRSAI